MTRRFETPRLRLLPTLVMVIFALLSAAVVESQCNVTNTTTTLPGSPTIFVTKTLSAPASCMTTGMNALFCFPSAASFAGSMLYAQAMTTTVAPYCNWSCTCGTGMPPHVVTDSADGLPVELMDFSIE